MKIYITKISRYILFLLTLSLFLTMATCEKEDEWIQIESYNPDKQLGILLDSIFSQKNNCLLNFQADNVFHAIFSNSDFMEIDSCNNIPEIDFNEYTLIIGKIMVSSISDSISNITLSSNNTSKYELEVFIYKPDGRYAAIGQLYFWRLYPKLESENDFELLIN